jgi:hypothetical protein
MIRKLSKEVAEVIKLYCVPKVLSDRKLNISWCVKMLFIFEKLRCEK